MNNYVFLKLTFNKWVPYGFSIELMNQKLSLILFYTGARQLGIFICLNIDIPLLNKNKINDQNLDN